MKLCDAYNHLLGIQKTYKPQIDQLKLNQNAFLLKLEDKQTIEAASILHNRAMEIKISPGKHGASVDELKMISDLLEWYYVRKMLIKKRMEMNDKKQRHRLMILDEGLKQLTPEYDASILKNVLPCAPISRGGSLTKKVFVLGRERKVTKIGRKSIITYKGQQISLRDARVLDKKQTPKQKKHQNL